MKTLNKQDMMFLFHRSERIVDLTDAMHSQFTLNKVLKKSKDIVTWATKVTQLEDKAYVVDSIRLKENESKEHYWDQEKTDKVLVGISEALS